MEVWSETRGWRNAGRRAGTLERDWSGGQGFLRDEGTGGSTAKHKIHTVRKCSDKSRLENSLCRRCVILPPIRITVDEARFTRKTCIV